MSTPNHWSAPGTFVTTKWHQGRRIFQIPKTPQIHLQTHFHYHDQNAYLLHEFVIMPDQLHLILTPSETTIFERAIGLIKGGSSHSIPKERERKMEIWQRGFYDWTIRGESDWRTKVQYIRMNPVRVELFEKSEDWPYSSPRNDFVLDPMPPKYSQLSSGAEAPLLPAHAPGIKRRPLKEEQQPGSDGIALQLRAQNEGASE
jgi:putative transposase